MSKELRMPLSVLGGPSNACLYLASRDEVRESVDREGEAKRRVQISKGWGGGISSESGGEATWSQDSR